jgi:hypothetical protein
MLGKKNYEAYIHAAASRYPELIARLEAKRGLESKFVKDLKEQLRAMKVTQNKSAQDFFLKLVR